MPYTLTLSRDERKAFDWVADRYNAGTIASNLMLCIPDTGTEFICDAWNSADDIAFTIPEHLAWTINDLAQEEDYSFPCFSGELRDKLTAFCFSIV